MHQLTIRQVNFHHVFLDEPNSMVVFGNEFTATEELIPDQDTFVLDQRTIVTVGASVHTRIT